MACGVLLSLTGCMSYANQGYPVGAVYNGTQAPSALERVEASGQGKTGAKSGESCVTGIMGVAAFGDGSLDAAKRAGQITDVHSVEYKATAVLGFVWAEVCTIVHGN